MTPDLLSLICTHCRGPMALADKAVDQEGHWVHRTCLPRPQTWWQRVGREVGYRLHVLWLTVVEGWRGW